MLLSTTTVSQVFRPLGLSETVKMIARAGFDAYDVNLCTLGDGHPFSEGDWRTQVAQLRADADAACIVCNQAHAPFISSKKNGFGPHPDSLFDWHARSMEIAKTLGAKAIVVHVAHYFPKGEDAFGYNVEYYKKLEPVARELGIRIAIENLFVSDNRAGCKRPDDSAASPEDLRRYLDALNSDVFTVCLDVGHAGLVGDDADRFVRVLGNRIGALHVHDNDFADDRHTFPFFGNINWDALTQALAQTNYQGDFTFEVHGPFDRMPLDLCEATYRYLADIGRYLCRRIEEQKTSL